MEQVEGGAQQLRPKEGAATPAPLEGAGGVTADGTRQVDPTGAAEGMSVVSGGTATPSDPAASSAMQHFSQVPLALPPRSAPIWPGAARGIQAYPSYSFYPGMGGGVVGQVPWTGPMPMSPGAAYGGTGAAFSGAFIGAAPGGASWAAIGAPRALQQQPGAAVDAQLPVGVQLSSTLRELLSSQDQAMSPESEAPGMREEVVELKQQQQRADEAEASDAAAEAAAEGGEAQRAAGAEAPAAAAAPAPEAEGGVWEGMGRMVSAAHNAMRFGVNWMHALVQGAALPGSTVSREDLLFMSTRPSLAGEVQAQAAALLEEEQRGQWQQWQQRQQQQMQQQQMQQQQMQDPVMALLMQQSIQQGAQLRELQQENLALRRLAEERERRHEEREERYLAALETARLPSMAVSGAPRSPMASSPEAGGGGGDGGTASPAELPAVTGSMKDILDFVGQHYGNVEDMTEDEVREFEERIADTIWGRAASALLRVTKADPTLFISRCTGLSQELCARNKVEVTDKAGHVVTMELWESQTFQDPRLGGSTSKATVAQDTLGTSAAARDTTAAWVKSQSGHLSNLTSFGLTGAGVDPRNGARGAELLGAWVRERLMAYPTAYYGGELLAVLARVDYVTKGCITMAKGSGRYASETLEWLHLLEDKLRKLQHIPEGVPYILVQPPLVGNAQLLHPFNGDMAAPVPLIGNNAPWTRTCRGQMLIDLMLAQLIMAGMLYWVMEHSKKSDAVHLPSIIKSKSEAAASAGGVQMNFPLYLRCDPTIPFRQLSGIITDHKAWLPEKDQVTESNRFLSAFLYPYSRLRTTLPDGSEQWTLAAPADGQTIKTEDVLLNRDWIAAIERFRAEVGDPSLATFTNVEDYLTAITKNFTWLYRTRELHDECFAPEVPKSKGGKPGGAARDATTSCGHCGGTSHTAADCYARPPKCSSCKGDPLRAYCEELKAARKKEGVPNATGAFAVNPNKSRYKKEKDELKAAKDGKDAKPPSATAGMAALQAQAAATAAAGGPGPSLSSLKGGGGGGGGGGRPPSGGGGSVAAAARK
jgi:hypothetical protein